MDSKEDKGYRNVINLGLVSLFTDTSTEMILSILPLFIINELGATKTILGLVEGSGEFTSYLLRAFSGAISDKIGKRKFLIIIGYGLSTIAKPLFGLSTTWTHALAVRVTDRVGKGIRTAPRDALLSESVKKSSIGRAFGIHRSLDQAGAIVGPLLAFLLMPFLGIRGIFWLSFIPAAIAVIILLFFVREKKMSRSISIISNLRSVLHGRFLLLIIILTIFSLGAFNFSFILVRAMEFMPNSMIPLVYAIINITHTAIGYPSGLLSDRIGSEKMLIIGFTLFLLTSFLGLIMLDLIFIMAGVYGLYLGISETVQRAVVPKYIASSVRATAYGVYYLFIGISFLLANTIFGALWDYFNAQTAFAYSMVMSSIAIVGLLVFVTRH